MLNQEMSLLLISSDLIALDSFSEGALVKTSLALVVAATSIFVFTQAADAQYMSNDVVLRAGSDDRVLFTDRYLSRTDSCLPPDSCLQRTNSCLLRSDRYLLRTDSCLLRSDRCLLSNFGVLRPNHGLLRGQWLLRLLRRTSRRIVRHWPVRLGRSSWNRPKVGSSRSADAYAILSSSATPGWRSRPRCKRLDFGQRLASRRRTCRGGRPSCPSSTGTGGTSGGWACRGSRARGPSAIRPPPPPSITTGSCVASWLPVIMLEQNSSIELSSGRPLAFLDRVELAGDVGELLDEELVHLQPVGRVGVRQQVVDHVVDAQVREPQRRVVVVELERGDPRGVGLEAEHEDVAHQPHVLGDVLRNAVGGPRHVRLVERRPPALQLALLAGAARSAARRRAPSRGTRRACAGRWR